jgi:hypothetical protein
MEILIAVRWMKVPSSMSLLALHLLITLVAHDPAKLRQEVSPCHSSCSSLSTIGIMCYPALCAEKGCGVLSHLLLTAGCQARHEELHFG